MGRSSSSRRKKRSKNSSQVRAKKKSKIRSRKSESKKLRRHYSSSSSDDDDDLRSSMSGSDYSSSSEDTKHRSKNSRVRTKKHVVKKKRPRHSYSSEDSHRARKRTGSKTKRDFDSKSKSSKKKRKRDDSVSESLSCSTCEDDSISGHKEVDFDRNKRKRGKEEKDERNLKKIETESKISRYESYSPLHSEHSESSEYQAEERVSVGNNSRRLRSVIVREPSQDEDKEVMYVHDDHDYPSSRSNDSNDSGIKREEQEKRETGIEIEKRDEAVVSDLRTPKDINSGDVSDTDERDRSNEFRKIDTVSEKTSEFSGSVVGANSDDLEAVLRQRALENLKRFRGAVVNQKLKNGGDAKQSSISNDESVRNGPELVGSSPSEVVVSSETQSAYDTAFHSQVVENKKDMNPNVSEPVPVKRNIDRPINQTTIPSGGSKEKVTERVAAAKLKLVRPVFEHKSSETNSSPKEASEEPEPRAESLGGSKSSLGVTASETTPTMILNKDSNGADANDKCISIASEPSLDKPTSGETSSDKPQDNTSEGSQFEKKTMSVMRGGEMVQVNYKVYIPKNAPALARRKLKR